MSPTENDLRNALHDGEGGGLDVDRVVAAGHTARVRRRNRAITGAATFVVVVGGGSAIAAASLGGNGSNGTPVAQRPLPTAQTTQQSAAKRDTMQASMSPMIATPGDQHSPGGAAVVRQYCPSSLPDVSASSVQSATGSAMFGDTVRSMTVCTYGMSMKVPMGSVDERVFTGRQATAIAQSVQQAAQKPTASGSSCKGGDAVHVLIIPRDAKGHAMPAVQTVLGSSCGMLSNGTAVRYGWTAPKALAKLLVNGPATQQPHDTHPIVGGGPMMSGSPVN